MDNNWQARGYFARYSWARIFKTGDRNKKIFFTVGVGAEDEALTYKLDCHYRSHKPENALTPEEVHIFNRIVKPADAHWKEISADELAEYSWESLIEETRDFIHHYTSLYDEVIDAEWNKPIPPIFIGQGLREQAVSRAGRVCEILGGAAETQYRNVGQDTTLHHRPDLCIDSSPAGGNPRETQRLVSTAERPGTLARRRNR